MYVLSTRLSDSRRSRLTDARVCRYGSYCAALGCCERLRHPRARSIRRRQVASCAHACCSCARERRLCQGMCSSSHSLIVVVTLHQLRQTRRYVLRTQSSEIMSKYFGDSEKAVRELFGASACLFSALYASLLLLIARSLSLFALRTSSRAGCSAVHLVLRRVRRDCAQTRVRRRREWQWRQRLRAHPLDVSQRNGRRRRSSCDVVVVDCAWRDPRDRSDEPRQCARCCARASRSHRQDDRARIPDNRGQRGASASWSSERATALERLTWLLMCVW